MGRCMYVLRISYISKNTVHACTYMYIYICRSVSLLILIDIKSELLGKGSVGMPLHLIL